MTTLEALNELDNLFCSITPTKFDQGKFLSREGGGNKNGPNFPSKREVKDNQEIP